MSNAHIPMVDRYMAQTRQMQRVHIIFFKSDQRQESYEPLSLDTTRPNVTALIGLSRKKGSPYSITERMVPELIPVLSSQPAGGVSQTRR